MPPESLLHEREDFADLIRIVADERGLLPALVEKDYWIMHCLYGLGAQDFGFELKGGTSLSKGVGITQRYSEDIATLMQLVDLFTEHSLPSPSEL